MKKMFFASLALISLANPANAQNVGINEAPTNIRFEQYTGSAGTIAFWRLPTPGTSVFPGTTCKNVKIPSDKPEHASRFIAIYLFAKNSNKNVFYYINPTNCTIVSFGMDG